MGEKKELVQSMSAFNNGLMLLMPVSVSASVWLVSGADNRDALCHSMASVAAFYTAWALLNKFTTKPYEKGHIPLSMLLVGCLVDGKYTSYLAVLGSAGTWIAFAVAAQRVFGWPASKLAYVSKKTLTWAHVLRFYFAASLCSWAYFTYRLAHEVL